MRCYLTPLLQTHATLFSLLPAYLMSLAAQVESSCTLTVISPLLRAADRDDRVVVEALLVSI